MGRLKKLHTAVAQIWPPSERENLPERISAAIALNEDTSEVLVKLIQFGVFALWGIAYLAAPQPNPETTSQVPAVIGVYLAYTLLLLFIAITRRMPVWLIYFSILVDLCLLTYLIWSFHIQYGQPASFSLKVVEAMNYFVLIGLRALRFEARYVIAAGVAAAVCWALLVMYVVFIDPIDTMITRDYITYLTSNTVLIGAEVSKVISILMLTGILAIAVRRGNSFLVSAVEEGRAAKDLSRFLSNNVAAQIRESDHKIEAGEGVRREAAILNVDIRGFTNMVSDMPPDEAMAILSEYQHQIVPIAHRHNGQVDKFMGDGIMITFGATQDDKAYCANALRCIDDIVTTKAHWKAPIADLNINLAATAGPVIAGVVGDGDRLEATVIGSSVNLSAKLEKHNKVLQSIALCDAELFRKAVEQGYQNPRERKRVTSKVGDAQTAMQLVILA